MIPRRWVISVLSTDYDLHEQRKAVIEHLRARNVAVSAFELPDFPIEVDIHSHDSCLRALARVDIALLIIDKRYGGIYIGDKSHSITQEEYLTAVRSKKPCLAFVSEQTWNELHTYKVQFQAWMDSHRYTEDEINSGFPRKQFNENYVRTHVESIDVLTFVETIQKAYDSFGISNWISFYSDIPDLIARIDGKLHGLSRFLLEGLVLQQRKNLENRHTSTGLGLSLKDVFSRGFYIEPLYHEESGELCKGATLDDVIYNTLLGGSSILLFGEAGCGKTTLLAKSYLSHVQNFLQNDSYQIPFYLWLKEKNCDYHFSFSEYINESFVNDWNRELYPYMDLSNILPYFYFDGFDEIAEKLTAEDVERMSRADIFAYPTLLTCRQQYSFRYISNFSFSDRFGVRIRIDPWEIDQAISYINNFCKVNKRTLKFATTLHHFLFENVGLRDVLNSPLLITMLLWVIETNRMQIPVTISSRLELFEACLRELAKRELTRHGKSESLAPDLINIWSYAAWEIYYNKLRNIDSKMSVMLPKVINILTSSTLNFSESYFEAIFDCSADKIFGAYHEQFLEYLVARALCVATSQKIYPYPIFLSFVVRPEINRFFRAIWQGFSGDIQSDIVRNLYQQYESNLWNESFSAVSTRVHAIYHIARLASPEREGLISKAFNVENHISVQLSLFFGSIKMGRLNDEQKFYDLLTTNSKYNDANRGYHLAYYSDAIMDNCLPFCDDKQKKWTGTLSAFLRHFESADESHYFLRRIEIVTMMHFVEARNFLEPLTVEIIDTFGRLVNSSSFSQKHPEYQAKVEVSFIHLKEVSNRLINGVIDKNVL